MSGTLRLSRVLALMLGAGAIGGVALPALVAGTPRIGSAELTFGPGLAAATPTPNAQEREAIELLRRAATAGRDRTYAGTQFVNSWSRAGASSVVVDLQHMPGRGMLVRLSGGNASNIVDDAGTAALDPRALAVLERHYSLAIAPHPGQCAGRTARIVEARPRGSSAVAGRFWLDEATGLVLRRELYDHNGRTVRAAAFVDLQMAAPRPWTGPSQGSADDGVSVADAQLATLRRDGWQAPERLSGGLELLDARRRAGELQLSYTDGLFAVSVFAQRGRLDSHSVQHWQRVTMGDTRAWAQPGLSEKVVWAGGDWVYTAVADAPDAVVSAAVAGFPAVTRESFQHRVWRGLHRMGSWFDPTG